MSKLPLDDRRWTELSHRGGSGDERLIPNLLAELERDPNDSERISELWPCLNCEGDTYAAAYAAVPYLVDLASRAYWKERSQYLSLIGCIETDSNFEGGPSYEIKNYLVEGYKQALVDALKLTLETLMAQHDAPDTRYMLATVAALKGHRKLAGVLQDMDALHGQCPQCGECVWPDRLQAALD